MVLLSRIYTKSGDKGKTGLGNNERVFKNHPRIEAIGTVDEANAFIGWAYTLSEEPIASLLRKIQNDLFDLGADLCVPSPESEEKVQKLKITSSQVETIEKSIDEYNAKLVPLTSFILPGGDPLAASLHLARTVVRRAERCVVTLHQETVINDEILRYLNRLSDLLFVLARYVNLQKEAEVLWVPGANR